MRQFLVGQRFFKEEFGAYCKEVRLRDYGDAVHLCTVYFSSQGSRCMIQKCMLFNTFEKWEAEGTNACTSGRPSSKKA